MDKNTLALELIELGKQEAATIRTLAKIHGRRCDILKKLAASEEAGLSDEVKAASVEPKD